MSASNRQGMNQRFPSTTSASSTEVVVGAAYTPVRLAGIKRKFVAYESKNAEYLWKVVPYSLTHF